MRVMTLAFALPLATGCLQKNNASLTKDDSAAIKAPATSPAVELVSEADIAEDLKSILAAVGTKMVLGDGKPVPNARTSVARCAGDNCIEALTKAEKADLQAIANDIKIEKEESTPIPSNDVIAGDELITGANRAGNIARAINWKHFTSMMFCFALNDYQSATKAFRDAAWNLDREQKVRDYYANHPLFIPAYDDNADHIDHIICFDLLKDALVPLAASTHNITVINLTGSRDDNFSTATILVQSKVKPDQYARVSLLLMDQWGG